jgi:hypothetical protein
MNLSTSTPANDRTNHSARAVARAILSTLDASTAAFVLVTLANFARTIVDAAELLHRDPSDEGRAMSRGMLAAAVEAFDRRSLGATDPSTHTHALAALWWFASPSETVAAFKVDNVARGTVEELARGALVDVEALRAEQLARQALPLEVPGAVEARASNDGGALLPRVARVLYFAEPANAGYGDVAAGLAALVGNHADGEDGAGLVCGLAQLGHYNASAATESVKVDAARASLRGALDALEAAAAVARATLAALDAAAPDASPHSVEVRAE